MVPSEYILANKAIIPFFGLDRQYTQLRAELLAASDRVYQSGQVLDGDHTRVFERAIARRCDRDYAIAVNSCTQGLIFALSAGIPAASNVVIPGISFAATVNSVIMTGHTPVFCDTDQNALIDLDTLDFALKGAGVECVMYANLFGHTVNWDRLQLHTNFFNEDIFVIEDAAQSFGATYKGIPSGKMGTVSVLSFDPTKNLPNYGSGGMILTDDPVLAEAFYDMRNNGKEDGHNLPGTNSRMSESDCAQMLVKLRYFDLWQTRRRQIAEYYTERLQGWVDVIGPGSDVDSAWHKFVIRLINRHALRHYLSNKGIETRIHYDKALIELPVSWEYVDYARDPYPESTAFTKECLSLPIYPELTDTEVEVIVESVIEFLN